MRGCWKSLLPRSAKEAAMARRVNSELLLVTANAATVDIEVVFYSAAPTAAYPRLNVHLDPNARLRLIERHVVGKLRIALDEYLAHERLGGLCGFAERGVVRRQIAPADDVLAFL